MLLTATFPLTLLADPAALESQFSESDRSYWAFQPVARPPEPALDSTWATSPIDRFVLAGLDESSLSPSPRADKRTLIRRAYFDLVGLPPTPEQVAAYLADDSPDAFAKVVDSLLESPHYGERWGRHWLDLARFAESEGFKADETRPHAWRYRDYVIDSFNQDKPYDRFVQEQIAGDELWPNDPTARIATGFQRHYPDETNAANMMQRRQENLQDITDTVALTFMGMTVGCAKCHDHKFDPILQKDYYRLQAFFANTALDDEAPMLPAKELESYKQRRQSWEQATQQIRAGIRAILDPKKQEIIDIRFSRYPDELQVWLRKPQEQMTSFERQMYHKFVWQMEYLTNDAALIRKLKGEDKQRYEALTAELAEFDHLNPGELPIGDAMRDLSRQAPPTHVLTLSNYSSPQDEVEPGFLTILDPGAAKIAPPAGLESTGRRTALARWLTDPANPLTARVMANRIWHYHFGRGIVPTPSDFGRMGDQPTHPELLDWLAAEFVSSGWSVKQMHRVIMGSAAYQQGSAHRDDAYAKDPDNRQLWRYTPRRLDAETLRDSALAAAGLLNPASGGPSVFPPLPDGMPAPRGGWSVSEDPSDHNRRSIYVFVRRNSPYPMLKALDLPDTHESCARREMTITAPQALTYINSNVTMGWAQAFAGRALSSSESDPADRVNRAYRLAFQRDAGGDEKDAAMTFLAKHSQVIGERDGEAEPLALPTFLPENMSEADGAAFTDFAHSLLNSNEFVFDF